MPTSRRHAPEHFTELINEFESIRRAFELPQSFNDEADTEAKTATLRHIHVDRTDRRYLSLDPPGSRDLDQAASVDQNGTTLRLHYAIADVAAWVEPGGAIDGEAAARGCTIYCPDRRVPLHPAVLSEGRASLLQGQDTPAVVWTVDIDSEGAATLVNLERALIRNHHGGTYEDAQRELDAGTADSQLGLIAEIGRRRRRVEEERGGISLRLPDQEVEFNASTQRAELHYRAAHEIEDANAQLSLTCGILAGEIMTNAGFGVLRTMPPAADHVKRTLRDLGRALGTPWPKGTKYGDWIRTIDPSTPVGVALLTASARTLRGAAYTTFDGALPDITTHSAIASTYAHVTAPLRRRSDRYATECVLAAVAGERPADWVTEALPNLGEEMTEATQRANSVDRACLDAMEAYVLFPYLGTQLSATVVGEPRQGTVGVYLETPAVTAFASVDDAPPIGSTVTVTVDAVDVSERSVSLSIN